MQKINKKELLEKYGIDLNKGKYSIELKNNEYIIYNYKDDTLGCILVGESKALDFIGGSKMAFAKLMDILTKTKEPITIEIK